MEHLQIGVRGDAVIIRNSIGRSVAGPWSRMLVFGRQLSWRARPGWKSEPDQFGPLTLARDGDEMVLTETLNGAVFAVLRCDVAQHVGAAIIHQAHLLEEIDQRDDVVFDQALLSRNGMALGLVMNPHLRQEAAREAAWNSQLRRYIPSSGRVLQGLVFPPVVSQEVVNESVRAARAIVHPLGG
jgi:hypothetical protein